MAISRITVQLSSAPEGTDHLEELTSVLLQEIRGLRDELREFKDEVASWRQDQGERLARVETIV
jgi:hypothetical protein